MSSLTVGVLNLNEASLTIDVLDKVALLSKAGWDTQLIVVDNGSSDDEVQCLTEWFLANKSRFAKALFIAASRNLGGSGGRNVILKLAAGEAFLFLDNDVILPDNPEWLTTLWQGLQADPNVMRQAGYLPCPERFALRLFRLAFRVHSKKPAIAPRLSPEHWFVTVADYEAY